MLILQVWLLKKFVLLLNAKMLTEMDKCCERKQDTN